MRSWALTRGAYSDYRVFATFDRKQDAEAAAKAYNETEDSYGECYVESSFHYAAGESPRKITYFRMSQNVWDDGTIDTLHVIEYNEWEYDLLWGPIGVDPSIRWVRAPVHRDKGGRIDVTGADKAECLRAVEALRQEVSVEAAKSGRARRAKRQNR